MSSGQSVSPRFGVLIELFLGDMTCFSQGDVFINPTWDTRLAQEICKKAEQNGAKNCSEISSMRIEFTHSGDLSLKANSIIINLLTGFKSDTSIKDLSADEYIRQLLNMIELK